MLNKHNLIRKGIEWGVATSFEPTKD